MRFIGKVFAGDQGGEATVPFITDVEHRLAPNQYGISQWSSTAKTAKSASFPASIDPFRSDNRNAHAPLIVAAAIASAGDIFIRVHASDIAIGMLEVGDVPGL